MKSKRSMNSDYEHTTDSESLLKELEKHPSRKPDKDDIKRVASMVNEYKGSIKSHLHEQQEQKVGHGERFADWVAKLGGSWLFVINFGLIVILWLAYDSSRSSLFILSFCLSVFTVFQAAMIQMSQNRQTLKDKQEQMLHIAINYKAEKENLEMQEKLHKIDNQLQVIENHLTSMRNPKFF